MLGVKSVTFRIVSVVAFVVVVILFNIVVCFVFLSNLVFVHYISFWHSIRVITAEAHFLHLCPNDARAVRAQLLVAIIMPYFECSNCTRARDRALALTKHAAYF